jgi:hypothetical protein
MRDPLSNATLEAIRTLWDETNPVLGTDAVYAYLEEHGDIARPQSLVPTLESLAAAGNFRLGRGFTDSEGAALHGARTIQELNPGLLISF